MHPITVTCDVPGMDVAEVSSSTSSASPPSSLVLRSREKVARKRARFNPDQRVKVNAVRKRGACLRCRLMKITVSETHILLRNALTLFFSARKMTYVQPVNELQGLVMLLKKGVYHLLAASELHWPKSVCLSMVTSQACKY
jgi:hypothetical protein